MNISEKGAEGFDFEILQHGSAADLRRTSPGLVLSIGGVGEAKPGTGKSKAGLDGVQSD